MKPFKEWAEEYGIVVDSSLSPSIDDTSDLADLIMSDIPISESEFTGKVTIKRMRVVDRDRFDAALLRRGAR
jgi:hypothetical protein